MLARAQQTVVVDQTGVHMIPSTSQQQSLSNHSNHSNNSQRPSTTSNPIKSHHVQGLSLTRPPQTAQGHTETQSQAQSLPIFGNNTDIAEKFVDSVNMIKELLNENSSIRQLYESISEQHQQFEVHCPLFLQELLFCSITARKAISL